MTEIWRVCVSSEQGDFEAWVEVAPKDNYRVTGELAPVVGAWNKANLPPDRARFVHVEKYPEERERLLSHYGLRVAVPLPHVQEQPSA